MFSATILLTERRDSGFCVIKCVFCWFFSLHWWADYLCQVITWTTRVVYSVSVDFSTWLVFYWYWSIWKFLKTFKRFNIWVIFWHGIKPYNIVTESDTRKLLVCVFFFLWWSLGIFVASPPASHANIQWGSFWMLLLGQQCMNDRSEV